MLNPSGKYLIYLRKSRADQEAESHSEGETLARHEHILLNLAKHLSISIRACYREIVSGESIAARPQMTRLLSEVEQGCWDGVLVMEVERLARGDTIDQGIVAQAFKYSDTLIITPSKIYDPQNEFDEEYFEFGLFMSRREYKTINRRLQRGRLQSAREGKYTGNVAPYGYERIKLAGEKGFSLTPLPSQEAVVRQIYTWFVYGDADGSPMGITKIRRKLNSLKIPSPKDSVWTDSTVHGILLNPVYNGKIRCKYRPVVKGTSSGAVKTSRPRSENQTLYPGLHPAIIPDNLFQAASARFLQKEKRPVPARYTVCNPLSGLVICERCHGKMERRPIQKGNDMLICTTSGCPTVGSALYLVEEQVLEALHEIVEAQLNLASASPHLPEDSLSVKEALLSEAKSRLTELVIKQNRLYDLLEDGIYTPEIFMERSGKLSEEKKKAETACQETELLVAREKQRLEKKNSFLPKAQHLLQNYSQLDNQEKNRILKELLDHISYRKDTRNKKGAGHIASFSLHLYPKVLS